MKRGLSTAVVITLIVLVLIIFFVFIAYFLIGLRNSPQKADCSNIGLSIKNYSNKPCYMMNASVIYLVKGSGDIGVNKIEFIFEKNSQVIKEETRENIDSDFANQTLEKVYVIEKFNEMPDKVSVAGIINKDGKEESCIIDSFAGIEPCYS